MNVHSPLEIAERQKPSHSNAEEPLDIRHLVFDDCATHPLKANGIHVVARQLVREQTAAGDRSRLVFLRSSKRKDADEAPDGIRMDVVPLAGAALRGKYISLARSVTDAIFKEVRPNTVFHLHGARQTFLRSLGRELERRKIPYGITVHGRYSHFFDRDLRPVRKLPVFYAKGIESSVLDRAKFVQALSETEQRSIRQIAPKAKVEVVANAAYSSAIDGAAAGSFRTAPSTEFPIFGFCGRYEIEHKGLDLLIVGFAEYRRRHGRGLLKLIGTGPARKELTDLAAAQDVSKFVTVDGPRFGAEKAAAIRSWDFFVQPSRYDGVPIGALEAALSGLPLIVTSETGLDRDIEKHRSGLVVGNLSAAAVAAALDQASRINIEEWIRMSRNARNMARAVGDWTAVARQLRQLYTRP